MQYQELNNLRDTIHYYKLQRQQINKLKFQYLTNQPVNLKISLILNYHLKLLSLSKFISFKLKILIIILSIRTKAIPVTSNPLRSSSSSLKG